MYVNSRSLLSYLVHVEFLSRVLLRLTDGGGCESTPARVRLTHPCTLTDAFLPLPQTVEDTEDRAVEEEDTVDSPVTEEETRAVSWLDCFAVVGNTDEAFLFASLFQTADNRVEDVRSFSLAFFDIAIR
jgi:hypothetical protein